MDQFSYFSAKAENAANRPGYHEFFVGAHNFNPDSEIGNI
jgi:hypothetical protein